MKLSISNIAWPTEDDHVIANTLQRLGVHTVELAPTKVFADPTNVSDHGVDACVRFWADHGITVGSFQSMLFGRPDLLVFGSPGVRAATIDRLSRFLELAGRLGARHLVFGSPKNRRVPEGMSPAEAADIAADFFADLGARAVATGVVLCIEPNPEQYGCNFITTASAGADLVRRVASPGFRLHLDAAGMTLAGDNIADAILASADVLSHYHASAPDLLPLEDRAVDHGAGGRALAEIGYHGDVAIEMREPDSDTVAAVSSAIALARRHYETL